MGAALSGFKTRAQEFAERRLSLDTMDARAVDSAIVDIDYELLKFVNPSAISVRLGTNTVDIMSDPVYAPLVTRFNDIKRELEQEQARLTALKAQIEANIIAGIAGNVS
jgi:hypothetical protein